MQFPRATRRALSKRIWKDFVIQIKAGVLPDEVIIVEHVRVGQYGYIEDYCYDPKLISELKSSHIQSISTLFNLMAPCHPRW